ncbi:putative tyrosine-protein phosphatase 1 [Stylophora pistillata]|uniref:Putative tyrosine-protein phosphatase 1 n=1 Tax=Stylophora pistillata TaxID=50429 RepID=A0A2B4RHG5_STYPI|nr:putative tyrosine-protein phosphatase 1 [Stylophora pistillata]
MNTEVVIDKRIPDKWRDYKPCGVPIEGEKIIAFKTPLSHQYDNESDQDNGIKTYERFTPMDLVNHLSQKHIKLGMVVDFTNTYRYYNSKELFDHGILYRKIKCVGKEIPDENVVERYLIECRGYTHEDAIKAFNKARGHDMERENYLEDLRKKNTKFDFPSYVCIGDNRKRDEIPFDRPRHLHTKSRYSTKHDAFEEDKANWRSNYIRGNTNGGDFRSRYHDQHVNRYQPPTSNPAQRRHYSERRFRNERHGEDNRDNYNRHDNYDRTYHNPERDHRNYSERNYNNYGDGYYYSNNFRGYDRGHYDYQNYASSSRSGRNREDSSRRDHVMRTTFVRNRPKPYTQHRGKRT